ncbi:MAG: hypothetical protein FJ265_18775, partial [Planctomycetes bacterium]|nr:hypothetical protein [Planctomycetota bacterium]
MSERFSRVLDRCLLALAAGAGFGAALPCTLHPESLAVLGLPAPPADAARTLLAQGYRAAVDWLAAFDWARLGLPAFTAGTHRAALWLAAAAIALAAVCVHGAATEVGVSRRRALLAALLGATCPAVAVAATTIH